MVAAAAAGNTLEVDNALVVDNVAVDTVALESGHVVADDDGDDLDDWIRCRTDYPIHKDCYVDSSFSILSIFFC